MTLRLRNHRLWEYPKPRALMAQSEPASKTPLGPGTVSIIGSVYLALAKKERKDSFLKDSQSDQAASEWTGCSKFERFRPAEKQQFVSNVRAGFCQCMGFAGAIILGAHDSYVTL